MAAPRVLLALVLMALALGSIAQNSIGHAEILLTLADVRIALVEDDRIASLLGGVQLVMKALNVSLRVRTQALITLCWLFHTLEPTWC